MVAAVVAVALLRGGAPYAALGITAPPTVVQVATPLARLVVLLASGTCLGGLLGAVIARPTTGGGRALGAHGYLAVRRAGAAAGVWAAGSLAAAALTVLGGTGGGDRVLAAPDAFLTAAGALEEPAGFLVAAVLAAVVWALCRVTLSWRTAVGALPLAALGVVAPVVTGQVASAGAGHDLATDAAALAAVAGAVWFGLLALEALVPGKDRAAAARARPVMLVAAGVAVAGTVVVEVVLVRGAWLTGVHGSRSCFYRCSWSPWWRDDGRSCSSSAPPASPPCSPANLPRPSRPRRPSRTRCSATRSTPPPCSACSGPGG